MKNWIPVLGLGVVIGSACAAPEPPHHPATSSHTTQEVTRVLTPMSPAQHSALVQMANLDQAAEAALNAGDYAEAEADAQQSLATGMDVGWAREVLAASLYSQGRTQEALQVYRQIADQGAYAARNEWPYAMLLLKSGHWAQAVAAYDTALRLGGDVDVLRANSSFSPDVPQPTELEAAIHIGMGIIADGGDFHGAYKARNQEAVTHFQQALTLVPEAPVASYYYGYGLRRMGRRADAQEAFKKAAALDVDNGDVKAAAEKALAGR